MAPVYYILLAFPCVVAAIVLAVRQIYKHLLNYTEPTYQRYIVRIIFMVPVGIHLYLFYLYFHRPKMLLDWQRKIFNSSCFRYLLPCLTSLSCSVRVRFTSIRSVKCKFVEAIIGIFLPFHAMHHSF